MNGWRISKSGQQPFENSLQQRAESARTGATTSISIHPSVCPFQQQQQQQRSLSTLCVWRRGFVWAHRITNDARRNPSIGRTEEPLRAMMRRTKREKTGCAVVQRHCGPPTWERPQPTAATGFLRIVCDAARRRLCGEWAPNRGGGVSERIALRTMCAAASESGCSVSKICRPIVSWEKYLVSGPIVRARQQIAPRGSRFWCWRARWFYSQCGQQIRTIIAGPFISVYEAV